MISMGYYLTVAWLGILDYHFKKMVINSTLRMQIWTLINY
jgi:hypothetical protein